LSDTNSTSQPPPESNTDDVRPDLVATDIQELYARLCNTMAEVGDTFYQEIRTRDEPPDSKRLVIRLGFMVLSVPAVTALLRRYYASVGCPIGARQDTDGGTARGRRRSAPLRGYLMPPDKRGDRHG
jgi:hypothetical protein